MVLIHSVVQALASLPALDGVRLIALASLEAVQSRGALPQLRRALACPVLVYGVGFFSVEEKQAINADRWVDRFYEPEEFLKALDDTMARTPLCDN